MQGYNGFTSADSDKNYIRWVRLLDRDIVRDLKDNQNERTARQLSESALVKPL